MERTTDLYFLKVFHHRILNQSIQELNATIPMLCTYNSYTITSIRPGIVTEIAFSIHYEFVFSAIAIILWTCEYVLHADVVFKQIEFTWYTTPFTKRHAKTKILYTYTCQHPWEKTAHKSLFHMLSIEFWFRKLRENLIDLFRLFPDI